MFLVHPSIPPEQMEGYAEVVGCIQAHPKSIRKKPGFLRMISPIDAELFP